MRTVWTCFIIGILVSGICSCTQKSGDDRNPDIFTPPDTALSITKESQLIGGPNAQGRVGDVLLANDKIRVIIQKPRKNAGVNSFGGNIIDADLVRSSGKKGSDNFGSLFPLVNVEWTVNYRRYEVISDGQHGTPKILRAHGIIDAYDYLDLDFIGEVAEGVAGQRISFSNRFDDRRNPFEIYDDLKGVQEEVITDYILEPGKRYVRIETTLTNGGDEEVRLPVGEFLNGSGELSMLIPGIGFTPDLMTQIAGNTPAVIYAGFDDVDVSYGYFFKASQFQGADGGGILNTSSVSYSDVTGLIFGEEFLKLMPLGVGGVPDINFAIPAKSQRTITSYFVVGDGSAGSVLDAGLEAIGAATRPISGRVIDADGAAVSGATVAMMTKGATLITYRTDERGQFSGRLPTGGNAESKRFGVGRYKVIVEKPGYHENGTLEAGSCLPAEIDLSAATTAAVICTLGETGIVELPGPVFEEESGAVLPVRLTIVGEDPSPNKVGSAGRFRSTIHFEQPFGVVDMKYITAKGTFDLTGSSRFALEPGTYRFVFSHGPEYSAEERVITVEPGGTKVLEPVLLRHVVTTPGFISADFHVHSIVSPDSGLNQKIRALSAAGEGLDILQSSDHDYITDYAPVVAELVSNGLIPQGRMTTSAGDEVTPNHYGHLHVFPLVADPLDPEGGAVDWSDSPDDVVGTEPDLGPSLDDLIATLRSDPGEEVIQINHIMDNPTGLPLACGWVTSPFYQEEFGVAPFSSYADPVERRMPPRSSGMSFPLTYDETALMTFDYDAVELAVGPHLHDESSLLRSALPTWFNLLNLGKLVTATADSDSHRTMANPIGLPRNFLRSSVDPRDGMGESHDAIDLEEYALNVRAGHLTISAGPFLEMTAKGANGETAGIGDTLTGEHATLTVNVQAPSWAWFDTIELYANTEPIPVDDVTDLPMTGTASDPATFYRPYHLPRYTYQPTKVFSLANGTLDSWKEEEGKITASVTFDLECSEDTWVVAMARGTRKTEGYRSLFPIVTNVLIDPEDEPDYLEPSDLSALHADSRVGAAAWALTNPIFIDVEGDGFVAKYVREGISPLKD